MDTDMWSGIGDPHIYMKHILTQVLNIKQRWKKYLSLDELKGRLCFLICL